MEGEDPVDVARGDEPEALDRELSPYDADFSVVVRLKKSEVDRWAARELKDDGLNRGSNREVESGVVELLVVSHFSDYFVAHLDVERL